MADTITEIYGQQFSDNIIQLAQQTTSKLYPYVMQKTNVNSKQFFQDQIGKWEMKTKAGRGSDTPSSDPNLKRRMTPMQTFNDAVLLDHSDDLKIISDPKSSYTVAAGGAIGRQIDDVLIDAMGNPAFSGETGIVSVPFPTSQEIVVAGTGLTFDKVKQAKRKLNDKDVEQEDCVFVCSPAGIEDLLGTVQATSSDYTTLNAIMNGGFDNQSWMGFKWIMSTRLKIDGASVRSNYAFHRNAIVCGTPEVAKVRTDERSDKSYAWQIYYEINLGATRLEEDRIVKIFTSEA